MLSTPFTKGVWTAGRRESIAVSVPQGDNRVAVLISRGDGISTMSPGRVGWLRIEYRTPLGNWLELAACSIEGGDILPGPKAPQFTGVFTHLPGRSRLTREVRVVLETAVDLSAEILIQTDATAEKDPDGPEPPGSVAYDGGNSATALASATVSVSSFTVSNNSNRCLIGVVGANNSAGAPGTVSSFTWNTSENLTQITSWDVTQTDTENWGYYLLAPTATTANLSVTLSASVSRLMLGAVSLYNVNQSTPFGTIQSAQGTTGTIAAVGCAGHTDGMSLSFLFGKTEGASLTVASHAGYPYYVAVGTASQSAGATSLTPTGAPAGRLLGDVEFCSIATENNNAISCSGTGWTKIGSTVQQDSTWQQETWCRIYDGSNVNPAFSWSGSVGCSARRWLMRDLNMTDLEGFHATNSGSGSTHSTTGQNTTANLSRVMYVDHAEANTAIAQPSGWTENFDAGSATGPYRLAVGGKDVATSGTGSGNISVTGAAASWVQRQIELLAATAQSHRFEAESIDSGTCCGALATEPGATYNTFRFDTNNTMSQWVIVAVSVRPSVAATSLLGYTPIRRLQPLLIR